MKTVREATFRDIDGAVTDVAASRGAWLNHDHDSQIALLDRLIGDTYGVAADWVEVECERKGIPADSAAAGEEWFASPLIVVRHLRLLRDTLRGIARSGRPDLAGPIHALPDGTTVAEHGWRRVCRRPVYRPSIVLGDSRTGETQKYDGLYFALQLLLRPRVARSRCSGTRRSTARTSCPATSWWTPSLACRVFRSRWDGPATSQTRTRSPSTSGTTR